MNCTQCGAPVRPNQKFCVQCGAALTGGPAPVQTPEPKLDLSAYFDNTPTVPEDQAPDNLFDVPARPRIQPETEPAYPPEPEQIFQPGPQSQPPVQPKAQSQPRQEQRVQYPAQPQRPREQTQMQRPQAPRRPVAPPAENTRVQKSEKGLNIALLICTMLAVAVLTFVIVMLVVSGKSGTTQEGETVIVTAQPQEGQLPTPSVTEAPTVIVTPTPLPATPTPSPTPSPTPTPKPASEYLLPESNTRYLTEADISGLSHEQLCFARNEIFARHGRIFKTPEIAAYFNSKSWYHGTVSAADFSESVFNEYERANIALIRDYENKHYGGSYY